MGVYLHNMKMPEEPTPITIYPDGKWMDFADGRHGMSTKISKHGRLIDADKFKDYIMYGYESNKDLFVIEKYRLEAEKVSIAFCKDIDEQETIIPAQEAET